MPQYYKVDTRIVINGTELKAFDFKCTNSSYGSTNTFNVETSVKQTKTAYPNIFQDQENTPNMPIQIYVTANGGSSQLIFTGIVDKISGDWEDDVLHIAGRDSSAKLRDETTTLDLQQYYNQPISKIVTQIANNYGFTPKVTETEQMAGIRYVSQSNDEYALTQAPAPPWHALQQFAQQCGFICYITSKNELYFGPSGQGSSHTFVWRPNQQSASGGQTPIYKFSPAQQSQRCKNFTVDAFSYDSVTKQNTHAQSKVGDGSVIYPRHPKGFNQEKLQQYADAEAQSIAKRDLVIDFTVDGDTSISVDDQCTIQEGSSGDLLGLANRQMYISSITHSFGMATYASATGDGFWTHITAVLNVPSQGE